MEHVPADEWNWDDDDHIIKTPSADMRNTSTVDGLGDPQSELLGDFLFPKTLSRQTIAGESSTKVVQDPQNRNPLGKSAGTMKDNHHSGPLPRGGKSESTSKPAKPLTVNLDTLPVMRSPGEMLARGSKTGLSDNPRQPPSCDYNPLPTTRDIVGKSGGGEKADQPDNPEDKSRSNAASSLKGSSEDLAKQSSKGDSEPEPDEPVIDFDALPVMTMKKVIKSGDDSSKILAAIENLFS